METFGTVKSGGANRKLVCYSGDHSALAAGTGDATFYASVGVNRLPQGAQNYEHAELIAMFDNAIGTGEKATGYVKIQHSDDDVDGHYVDFVDEYGHGAKSAEVADGAGSPAESLVIHEYVALAGAKQFIRVAVKVDLSRGATDTSLFRAVVLLGAAAVNPL